MTIKLFFLQASRSIRTAWHLEELGLDYEVDFAPRVNKVASPEFKKKAGGLGKFPTLVDDGETIYESGNIAEYLEEKYDKEHKLLSADMKEKYRTLYWVHTSEGMYMLHGLPFLYAGWFLDGHKEAQEKLVQGLGRNMLADLKHLEEELGKIPGRFLMGDKLTVADISMHFSLQFIIARQLGTQGHSFPKIEQWLKDCEATEGYKRAVEKTGYDLSQSG